MTAIRVNHVSVHAPDLEASVAWYRELFGARPIPTPNFGMPVQWLGIGDTQVHLFHRDADPPSHHHFAIAVDDFAAVYRRAPGGNLVEVDAPALSELPEEIVGDSKRLADVNPQDEENLSARLYLGDQSRAESPVR